MRTPVTTNPDPERGAKRDPQRQPARPQQHPLPEDPHSEEPEFVDEPDLPPGEPSGQPTRSRKPKLTKRALPSEPMTGAQKSYLKTLCEQADQPFDDTLTKAQASKRIDELHRMTRRGEAPAVGRDVAAHGGSRA
jgi:hypothetical protein